MRSVSQEKLTSSVICSSVASYQNCQAAAQPRRIHFLLSSMFVATYGVGSGVRRTMLSLPLAMEFVNQPEEFQAKSARSLVLSAPNLPSCQWAYSDAFSSFGSQ